MKISKCACVYGHSKDTTQSLPSVSFVGSQPNHTQYASPKRDVAFRASTFSKYLGIDAEESCHVAVVLKPWVLSHLNFIGMGARGFWNLGLFQGLGLGVGLEVETGKLGPGFEAFQAHRTLRDLGNQQSLSESRLPL